MKTITNTTKLAVRIDDANPLHHLWKNNGTWWCHLTVHRPDHSSERVRLSLKTGDPAVAQERRDRIFATKLNPETQTTDEAQQVRDSILSRKGGFSS